MAMKNRTGLAAIGFTTAGFIFVLIAFCTPCWLETDGTLSDPQFVRIVFFEPTDFDCSKKPFQTKNWHNVIKYISPNLNELQVIAKHFGATIPENLTTKNIKQVGELARIVAKHIETVLVTLGCDGLIIAHSNSIRHYPALACNNVINVSGAGDCLAAGFITAMLAGKPEEMCVNIGMHCALSSLRSQSAIPKKFDLNSSCWGEKAKYFEL